MLDRTATHAKIASGASLSGEVDLRGKILVAIQAPAAWTAADLSFQAAEKPTAEGGVYGEVFEGDAVGGGAALVVDAAASQYTLLNFEGKPQNCMLKVRSGTSGVPVLQGADRDIILYVQPF